MRLFSVPGQYSVNNLLSSVAATTLNIADGKNSKIYIFWIFPKNNWKIMIGWCPDGSNQVDLVEIFKSPGWIFKIDAKSVCFPQNPRRHIRSWYTISQFLFAPFDISRCLHVEALVYHPSDYEYCRLVAKLGWLGISRMIFGNHPGESPGWFGESPGWWEPKHTKTCIWGSFAAPNVCFWMFWALTILEIPEIIEKGVLKSRGDLILKRPFKTETKNLFYNMRTLYVNIQMQIQE